MRKLSYDELRELLNKADNMVEAYHLSVKLIDDGLVNAEDLQKYFNLSVQRI